MNNEIVRSNKNDVEASLRKTFANARSIQYKTDGVSLKGIARYRNQWYSYSGAIGAEECCLSAFMLALIYGFLGAMDFLLITNVVWAWIVFVIIFVFATFSCCGIGESTRDSEVIVITAISFICALVTLLVFWQIQKANPGTLPQTLHLDWLFKFHFKS